MNIQKKIIIYLTYANFIEINPDFRLLSFDFRVKGVRQFRACGVDHTANIYRETSLPALCISIKMYVV